MAIITLTTDFGTTDAYAGIMKGVILGIAPFATIVDLSHEITPQNILAGALALESAVNYFPDGTIHVAVVDPSVGGDRYAITIETERFTLVGPDNGIFTLALHNSPLLRAVRLTNAAYHLSPTSETFHGRDIFAPAAAYLASGIPSTELGELTSEIRSLEVLAPSVTEREIEFTVLHIDRFGNLITNLTAAILYAWLPESEHADAVIHFGKTEIRGMSRTFSDVAPGSPVAYIGSGGRLEIGVRDGSAAKFLHAAQGTTFTIHI